MADLVILIPNHGYSDDDTIYVSWLDENYYVSDKQQDSFKLALESGGSTLVQYTENVIDGFVREVDLAGASTSITGLDHLEGELVQLMAEGVYLGLYTVSGGSITPSTTVYTYSVGLPYTSILQPMKLNLEDLGLATTKKPSRAVLSLHQTVGGEIGSDTENIDAIKYRDAGASGEEFPFFTGDLEIPLPGGYGRSGDILIRQTEPLPMTVLALTLDVGAAND